MLRIKKSVVNTSHSNKSKNIITFLSSVFVFIFWVDIMFSAIHVISIYRFINNDNKSKYSFSLFFITIYEYVLCTFVVFENKRSIQGQTQNKQKKKIVNSRNL